MHLRYKNGPKKQQQQKKQCVIVIIVWSVFKVLEQDKYSLQKELELKTRMLQSLQSDFDYMKNQQIQQAQEQRQHLERIHSTVLSELNNKVDHDINSTYSW